MSAKDRQLLDMDTHRILSDLVDGELIERIEGTLLPAPDHAEHPGNHLIVNCLCTPTITTMEPATLLRSVRTNTMAIIRALKTEGFTNQTVSVCVTFVGKPVGFESLARLYRFNILTNRIPHQLSEITEAIFQPDDSRIQYSDVTAITTLLQGGPKG
jgi:hypothetical protein